MSYRIKTVADMTGVPRQTLLSWERRYGLPNPARLDNGYRVYSDDDIALIVRVQQMRGKGYSISEAMTLVGEEAPETTDAPSEGATEDLVRDLISALLGFDRQRAEQLDARTTLMSFEQRLDDIYLPTLRAVGDRWHDGKATVGQEHFASYFLRERLIGMLRQIGSGPAAGPVAVCGGYPGEQHEFGLLSVALKMALRGYRIVYLGPDMPPEDLAAVARERDAALVLQSVMKQTASAALELYAERLLDQLPPDTLLAIGGPGVHNGPSDNERIVFASSFASLQERLLDDGSA